MPSPLEAHLRSITPAQATLTRLLGCALPDAEANAWRLRLAPRAAPMEAPVRLSIRSALCDADVVVESAEHPALLAIAQDTDVARRTALAGLWLAPLLDTLAAVGMDEARLADLGFDDTHAVPPAGVMPLPLRLTGPQGSIACRIATLDWKAAPPAPPTADRNAILSQLGALALSARIRIASRRCAADTLASLAPGDILLGWEQGIDHPTADEGTVRIAWGDARHARLTATAHYKEGTVTILDVPMLTDDNTPADGQPADAVPVQALEVPVHLELAVMGMPLAELAALAPDHVLQLPVKIRDATVTLVCHGQTLGHGRLVAVGDHLGLQISAMSARHAEH